MAQRARLLLGAGAVVMTMAEIATAHEGHGDPARADSALHYLVEPVHLPFTVLGLAALVLAARWVSRKPWQRRSQERRR